MLSNTLRYTFHGELNTPVLRLRRIGNSLGLILPREFVDSQGLHPDDALRVDVERAIELDDVFGALRKYRRSATEWTSLIREGDAM